MIEDEKLDQEEALQQAKTVSNTLTKSFGEYKQAYLMNQKSKNNPRLFG